MRLFPSRINKEKKPSVKVEVVPEDKPQVDEPKKEAEAVNKKPKMVNTFELSMAALHSDGSVTKTPRLVTDSPLDKIVSNLQSLDYGFDKEQVTSVTLSVDVVVKEVE